jgi:hypothetical protein
MCVAPAATCRDIFTNSLPARALENSTLKYGDNKGITIFASRIIGAYG